MAKGVKTAAKRASKVKEQAEPETAQVEGSDVGAKQRKRLMQPAGCRTYMRNRLAKEFPQIVDGFVEEAKKGSCNHVKQAMEMLKPVRKGTSRRKGTAEMLLEELRRD